jgi:hypothetical protein
MGQLKPEDTILRTTTRSEKSITNYSIFSTREQIEKSLKLLEDVRQIKDNTRDFSGRTGTDVKQLLPRTVNARR